MKKIAFIAGALLCGSCAFADWDSAADNLTNRTLFAGSMSRLAVKEDLQTASESGNAIGRYGVPMKWLARHAFPPDPLGDYKSRMQVRNELAQAMREGEMFTLDQSGLTYRQLSPDRYAHIETARQVDPPGAE